MREIIIVGRSDEFRPFLITCIGGNDVNNDFTGLIGRSHQWLSITICEKRGVVVATKELQT